ncbi:hypothetical protein M0R88_03205 [Halorussus gelatinilyticus]|uniref:YtxH domain-containing protein n=1 Tax=Halorussus gelatinilyticus TaxID=2937524 RepID=A0A8U0IJ34_9EURY|nr:hypothetical protein [Halorussus gelatinilyticus]UPW01117.1 hypothetical protein M0R88_03205 [Halorussus gelatinilyticus]
MSGILSEITGENRAMDDGARGQIVRAVKMAIQDGDGMSADSREGEIVRTFLLVDLGAAMNYLRGRRGSSEATEALTELAPEADLESDGSSGGRGMLSRLFLLGVVVGLGYAMSKRSESVGETVGRATDRVREVADQTAIRSGEAAQRTEAVAGEAADRIEEGSEMAAERVQEGGEAAAEQVRERGEMAADSVQEGGEEVSEDMERAADTAEDAEEKVEDAESSVSDAADEAMPDDGEDDEESEE